MFNDCEGIPLPVYCDGVVTYCGNVNGAVPEGSVFLLKIETTQLPAAGQFFMLHPQRSNTLLARPISVYHVENLDDGKNEISFLILLKGKGTEELKGLRSGDKVNLLGPCGNKFEVPENGKKVLIVGGGIGVAPVAGFAETLWPETYDFYASFKSGSYGLDFIKPEKLVITTDDGSVGVHGMLPAALTEEAVRAGNYSAVYACGPTPMLAYVKKVAEACGVKCWISMEARMACGVGVCLGCTIDTTEGKKRCCKDGPVFDSKLLPFDKPADSVAGIKVQPRREPLAADEKADLSVDIAGVHFENPVIGCSGTFGFGTEYASVFDVNKLGGIASKGLTFEPRQGNNGIRIWEIPSGVMNSIGLQNPGIAHFIAEELPEMMALKPVAIANLSGSTMESYVEGAKLLDKTDVPMIELNISCPNVKAGGAAWGMTCSAAGDIVKAVRAVTTKPLVVKLTPQSLELNKVALACIEAGADGISLCNSFQGIAIDIERGVPVFENLKAGVGGPAIRPIAVRLVYELVEAINNLPVEKRVPVIAIGGIATWQDAVEFIMAGASAIEVGTATFANPFAMVEIIEGLEAFMKRKGYKSLDDFRGIIQKKNFGKGLNPSTEVYAKNLENSIVSFGNNYRIKKVIEKLEAGKKVFVAAIGGSVTEGAGPHNLDGSEKWTAGYAFKFVDKLRKKYPKAEIVFDGAGVSGSPSALGVIRYEKDIPQVLGEDPDIFIIEFSVNDGGECTTTRGFERLIRNVLEAKKDAVVIPLYAHATYENTQASMIPVGEFYKLPQISIRNALSKEDCCVNLRQNGEFFDDYVHPTEEGHNYMADCIMYLFEKSSAAKSDEENPVPVKYFNNKAFDNFYAVYSDTKDENVTVNCGSFDKADEYTQSIKKGGCEFPKNWHHVNGTESFKVSLECKALIFAYKHQGSWMEQEFGKAELFVDGVLVKTLDGNAYNPEGKKSGWNDCVTELVIDSETAEAHTIEVKMASGEENKGFTILALGYSK